MRPVFGPSPLFAAIVLCTIVGASTARAASDAGDVDGLANALARLRGEVETLADDVGQQEAAVRERRATTLARRAELEAERERAVHRLARLQAEADRRRAETASLNDADAAITPTVVQTLDAVDAAIVAGLPFKRDERRAVVTDIRTGLSSGTLPPRQALMRTWSLIQDEERLTRENALGRQVITLDGSERQVETARLGMTQLYFKTPDGVVGLLDADRAVVASDAADQARIRTLFDALAKQLRVGAFELPVALREVAP